MKQINIGCGVAPTPGWYNYDNSLSVRLAIHPILTFILDKIGLLTEGQKKLISVARNSNIVWADATKRIPLPDSSVEVLYTSHMVEHLDREEVEAFLEEASRILAPNGIIRILVPDIREMVNQYIADGDADAFIERTSLTRRRPKTILDKLKYLIIGDRNHQWMYDGHSMIRLLSSKGFKNPRLLAAGSTTIPDPGELILYKQEGVSIYVEAQRS